MTNRPAVGGSSLRLLIDKYFEAWGRGVTEEVLTYFSENVAIEMASAGGTLVGKQMVAEQWVIPTLKNFPRNVHHITKFLEAGDHVVVEWAFHAVHVSTGKEKRIQGRSLYWLRQGLIVHGQVHIYSSPAKREGNVPAFDSTQPATNHTPEEVSVA